jgi:hypothetical protein
MCKMLSCVPILIFVTSSVWAHEPVVVKLEIGSEHVARCDFVLARVSVVNEGNHSVTFDHALNLGQCGPGFELLKEGEPPVKIFAPGQGTGAGGGASSTLAPGRAHIQFAVFCAGRYARDPLLFEKPEKLSLTACVSVSENLIYSAPASISVARDDAVALSDKFRERRRLSYLLEYPIRAHQHADGSAFERLPAESEFYRLNALGAAANAVLNRTDPRRSTWKEFKDSLPSVWSDFAAEQLAGELIKAGRYQEAADEVRTMSVMTNVARWQAAECERQLKKPLSVDGDIR